MATGFASTITLLRKKKGISQKNAAKDLGISQALLSHYENGIRECGLDFVLRAAQYYGVSCDYLLGNSNSSVRFDIIDKINDIPEDKELSINTVFRASATIGAKFNKSESNGENMKNLYAIYAYLLILKGVETGCIPPNWAGDRMPQKIQAQFLSLLAGSITDGFEKSGRPTKANSVPACVRTLTDWVNNYMNENLADLVI